MSAVNGDEGIEEMEEGMTGCPKRKFGSIFSKFWWIIRSGHCKKETSSATNSWVFQKEAQLTPSPSSKSA